MYCGTVAPEAGAEAPPERPSAGPVAAAEAVEPPKLTTLAATTALLTLAHGAYTRQDLPTTERLMSRPFLELHPDDLAALLGTMTEAWLKAMVQAVGPAGMAQASGHCAQAIAAAKAQSFVEAASHFAEARTTYSHVARANPVAELLALGALSAGRLLQARRARDPQLQELVDRASHLAVTPGHKAEALPLMKAALALLEPERILEDRPRAEKFKTLIRELESSAEVASDDPAAVLPPVGALPPETWDELGMQMLAEHPAQARVCFERATGGAPASGPYWLHLATALLAVEAGDEEVLAAHRKAVELAPGEIRAQVGLAAILQETGRYAEALRAWDAAIALAPQAERPRSMRAFCVAAAELVVQGAHDSAQQWRDRGNDFLDGHQWALADLAYGRALALEPRNLDGLCGKGLANVRWAQTLKAEDNAAARLRFRIGQEAMQEALRVDPANESVAMVLSYCAKELGEA